MDNFAMGNFPQIVPYDLPDVPVLAAQAFSYGTETFDLQPGQSVTQNIQIDADADFWVMKTQYGFTGLTNGETPVNIYTIPQSPQLPVVMNIRDTGDGRDLNKTPTLIQNIGGTGALPYIWPFPRRVRANAVLLCTFTNTSATLSISGLQYTFGGAKIWYPSNTFGTRGN